MKPINPNRFSTRKWIGVALALLILTGCNTAMRTENSDTKVMQLEEEWGVRPISIRVVGGGHFIDFRYRVINPDKAMGLLSRNNKPYLIDEKSGKVHNVPVTKLGPLRASAVKPKADRNYVVLFGNGERIIHSGSRVTVVIGGFRAQHLEVM